MDSTVKIPMFPLSIFPLPGEMVPLHIFEPRYRQLLEDAERKDIPFGIFFNHVSNENKLGSLVKLESVIKRYPSGESDIIVTCIGLFNMDKLFRTFRDKLYPGGTVQLWNVDVTTCMSEALQQLFDEYSTLLRTAYVPKNESMFVAANELNLGFEDRVKFVQLENERQESFLSARLKYQIKLLQQVELAKDVFHLN